MKKNNTLFRNLFWISILFCIHCNTPKKIEFKKDSSKQYIVVLGVAQDAGYPHPHCAKSCCAPVAQGKAAKKKVTCLGIVDKATEQVFMMEASPDFTEQERLLREHLADKSKPMNGILFEKSSDKSKIKFIHFNHTNPILRETKERQMLINQGFSVCTEGEIIQL